MIAWRTHNLSHARLSRSNGLGPTRRVDIHCHCLPGLDDGPATMARSLALCRALLDDGIGTVIATPHQLGRYDGSNPPSEVRKAVSALNSALLAEGLPLSVKAGADVRLDERIPALIEADCVLTLADTGRYILIELPHETFIDVGPLIPQLGARGITAILSHPERNEVLATRPEAVLPWVAEGVKLQITAASLLGDFGPAAEKAAWHWLTRGLAAVVATDAHDAERRPPRMSDAFNRIGGRLGRRAAERLCADNPFRILTGRDVIMATAVASLGGGP